MDPRTEHPNHREFTRVRLPIIAKVTVASATLSLMVRDVSLDGVSFHADADAVGSDGAVCRAGTPLEDGTPCTVHLRLEGAPDEPWITARGTVVRVSGDVVAVHFLDLIGVDGLNHLRSLLMYHAEDPDVLLAEFEAHWGLRPRERQL